ncbi:MAG: [FeFe] hydrogenase H-cluster radical SAM maturase HydG [bacterium]|nr:[FeFe] hydrogenase H-cluster radical SAM maturase HydG [bacterium]
MIIHEDKINQIFSTAKPDKEEVDSILAKSIRSLERLSLKEVATLLKVSDPELNQKIFDTALKIKELIYGNRIVFFAPLYISNYCNNNCLYCAFRQGNSISRKALNKSEILNETEALLKQGHKRVLLVAGESYHSQHGLDYILKAIDTIYNAKAGSHSIKRINVNIAPLEVAEFRKLKEKDIGTYQIFQETYHRATYKQVHLSGTKSNYDYRLEAIDRAFEAGFDDVGLGVLYGLADWKFETMALIEHIEHLESKFGIGPHTISVPRIEQATGAPYTENIPHKVSDSDFKKLVAVLRLAVPYTGIILSTRESPLIRRELLKLGISQISAGSRTNPGGYGKTDESIGEQFSLGDHRSLDEVVYDLLEMNFLPSFCTACYRLGRTGLDFMEYARPGDIRKKCEPNGLITFREYLNDFATLKTKESGEKKIQEWISDYDDPKVKNRINKYFRCIDAGQRDIFI